MDELVCNVYRVQLGKHGLEETDFRQLIVKWVVNRKMNFHGIKSLERNRTRQSKKA
ncbi:MAG TPA: hypothetical protein PK728_11245 [Bacillota bacterium]|nr:hypothetical protein [Bacillota bacterium]